MYLFLAITGSFCLLYYVGIALFTGNGANFSLIWLLLGVLLIVGSILLKKKLFFSALPDWFKKSFLILFLMGAMVFLFVEGCIVSKFHATAPANLDYIIVLGAQLKRGGPSRVLRMRLDEACEYLTQNPRTKVIVSGGQGKDEHISEAQGMFDYLVVAGIEKERIVKEDKSVNTFQNLKFSSKLIDIRKHTVGIVSNNFHIYRAVGIAKKEGFMKIYGIPAKSEPFLQANNMLREFFGIIKDTVTGNM